MGNKKITHVGALVWDEEYGEGSIRLPESLEDEPFVTQLDAMRDWIDALTETYNKTLQDYETRH